MGVVELRDNNQGIFSTQCIISDTNMPSGIIFICQFKLYIVSTRGEAK